MTTIKKSNNLFAPYFNDADMNYSVKISGTTYEVSTHFNVKGKQSILEQFKELILSQKLI